MNLLSRADQAIGRLDGEIRNMPTPDLFVAMYVRREAVLSSQIEGTQSTLDDLLAVELQPRVAEIARDVDEIVNVAAVKYGLRRLSELPLSLRLIRKSTPSSSRASAVRTGSRESFGGIKTSSRRPEFPISAMRPSFHPCTRDEGRA